MPSPDPRDLAFLELAAENADLRARIAEAVTEVRATLASVFASLARVFLVFSGGKDSLALAHLYEPWRDRLTLLWSNTGHMAPHMIAFVRGYRDRFDLVEVSPGLPMMEQWAAFGTPADTLPLEHLARVD